MNHGLQLLSDLTFYRTYSAPKPDGTKETWEETVERNLQMHVKKYPYLERDIHMNYETVFEKRVLPSMRSLQFAGAAIERENTRMYNCSYLPIVDHQSFGELFFILLCGTGVGYSVQWTHVRQLPVVEQGYPEVLQVKDNKEGWADAAVALLRNPDLFLIYDQIRPSGTKLSTGGTASGPEPLIHAFERIRSILKSSVGYRLSPLQVHDIVCLLADCVVVGGVRRAALIALFDWYDNAMLTCKHGEWWKDNPQRARANNSASIWRHDLYAQHAFEKVMEACFESNCGEPGIVWTNDVDWGVNPCCEIALPPSSFCNLTTINAAKLRSMSDYIDAACAAAFIGTLQAGYDNFGYLRPQWKQSIERERLLGVSMTGLAENWDFVEHHDTPAVAGILAAKNAQVARQIGIRKAARITCIKPEGSASAFLGTTSGVHAAHAPYYLRRIRIDRSLPMADALIAHYGLYNGVVEVDQFTPSNLVVTVPCEKKDAIMRDEESAVQTMERATWLHKNWIMPGHRSGANTHNVSLTVNYKTAEIEDVKRYMWENRDSYTGISLLPFSDHTYVQAPFEAVTEDVYTDWCSKYTEPIDFSTLNWGGVEDVREGEAACAGGQCTFI